MRTKSALVLAAVAPVLVLSGCGTVSVGGTASGNGEPPVLRVGQGGYPGMDAAKLSSSSGVSGFRIDGQLPQGPSRAPTYLVVRPGLSVVNAVAAALGLSATPRRHSHGWMLTSGGRELRIRDTGQWSYQRVGDPCPPYLVDVDSPDGSAEVACAVAAGTAVPKAGGTAGVNGVPAPTMSAAQLRSAVARLLSGLGLDPTSAIVSVEAGTVNVNPVVAGLPTVGYGTEVTVDNRGVRAASGWTYPDKPSAGATYPLVSALAALKRFESLPKPMMGAPEIACPAIGTKSPAGMPPGCGGPPSVLVVTGGRLGLELQWDGGPGGQPVLVPAWLLTVQGSDSPLVLVAVSPKYLADPIASTLEPNPAGPPADSPGSSGAGSAPSAGSGTP